MLRLLLIACVFATSNANCSFHCEALSCPCQCYRHDLRCFNKSLTSIGKFPSHEKFKYLDFAFNKITRLKSKQFHASCFKAANALQLSANNIEIIEPGAFSGLFELHSLFLSSNKIKTIHKDTFKGLESLKRIYLDNNKLQRLHHNTFKEVHKTLKLLYLQRNIIRHVDPSTFEKLHNLRTLDLSNNQLASLDGSFIEKVELSHLFLGENPWSCDAKNLCQTLWFVEETRNKDNLFLDTMICKSPDQYEGMDSTDVFNKLDCSKVQATQSQVKDSDGNMGNTQWVNAILIALCSLIFAVFEFVLFTKSQ